MSLPFISIVSINWNSVNDTLDLLASICNSDYPKSKYEVIVVDNGSTDGSVEKIKKSYPKTLAISLPKNIGIPARNIGLKKSKGEILLSVDSDVALSKDTLSTVVKKFQKNPSIGLISIKAIDKKTHDPLPYPLSVNFFTGVVSSLNPNRETHTATFVAGLLHAFPKKVIKKVGLYNPRFFFYGDDFDFSMRVKKAGFKVLYTPDTLVYHGKNKTTPDISHSVKYHHYYKALFRNIYTYGNLMQRISASFFQLFLIPFYRLLIRRENTFAMRWWGFWWNIKHLDKETKIFIFVFLIGLMLRLFAIDKRDFWFDEAFTYHIARLPLQDLFKAVLTDNNPPIYYLIIHFILKISNSEIAIRLPSTIFSLITFVLVYAAFKNHINSKVSLIAASLFSLSPLSLYMAGEARLHSLATLIVVLLVMVFFSLINKPTFTTLLIFIVISIAGLYTQYYISLFFLPFTWIVVRHKILPVKKWFFVLASIALSLSPWLLASAMTAHNGCSCPNTLLSLPSTLVVPAIGGVGEVTLRSFPKLPLFIFLSFAVVALSILLLFIRGLLTARLLTPLYLIPLIITSFAGLFLPVFSPKAFAIFSPIYFVIVGIGIASYRKSGLITLLFIGLMGTISIIQLTLPFFAGTRLKPLNNIIQKNQTVPVAHTSLLTYYSLNYYSQGNQKHILVTKNPLSIETLKFIGGQKQEVDKKVSDLWLVDTEKWTEAKDRENALKTISDAYYVEKVYKIDKISVSLLKQK